MATHPLLADALDYIEELRRHTFDLDDAAYEKLVAFAKPGSTGGFVRGVSLTGYCAGSDP